MKFLPFFQSLVQSAGIYTVSSIINGAIPFFILPLLTRYLTPEAYGITATFQVLVAITSAFVGLTIHGVIGRKYYDRDTVDFPNYIYNCLVILLVSSLVVGAFFWFGSTLISGLAVFPREWLWAVVVVSIGQFVCTVRLTLWQVEVKPVHYGIFQNVQSALNFTLSVVLVVSYGMSWQGSICAQIISVVVAGFASMVILWQEGWIKPGINTDYLKSALLYGVPIIPHTIGGWIMSATDRIMINKMVSVADTGVYTVAFQLAMIVGMIEVAFNSAWVPWLYENLGKRDESINLKIVQITYVYVLGIFSLALVLAVISPWLLKYLVGRDFQGAGVYVFWLLMARALDAMYFMTCNYLTYHYRTILIGISTVFASIVHVLATYFLVRCNGAIGAAQATIVSSLLMVAFNWYFAFRLHKMPWLLGVSRSQRAVQA